MKLFELFNDTIAPLNEEDLTARLKKFNWKYEFMDNQRAVVAGARELEILERAIYEMWNATPEKAVALWNANCPWAVDGVTPTFILRKQFQNQPE